MGGRGASAGTGDEARRVTIKGGEVVDLSDNPLKYGKEDSALTPAQRWNIEAQEDKRRNNLIEFGFAVDKNGLVVGEKRGGKGSMRPTAAMVTRGEVFTHNHPRDFGAGVLGGTFSDADMDFFTTYRIRTMRASAYEGTYSITKGAGFASTAFLKWFSDADRSAKAEHNARSKALYNEAKSGQITYDEYNARRNASFNRFLVEMHNTLLKGQKIYDYTYTLERRKT